MELTLKQQQGLNEALQRYKNHDKYVTIAGYAVTGNTTLVRFIIAALDVEESKVAYCSYTPPYNALHTYLSLVVNVPVGVLLLSPTEQINTLTIFVYS